MNSPDPTSAEKNISLNAEEIALALDRVVVAADGVQLAAQAEQLGEVALQQRCFEQAIALDRNCQAALLGMAALSLDRDESAVTFTFVEEAARAGLLPPEVAPLRAQLLEQVRNDERLDGYLRVIGRTTGGPAEKALKILLVTNLFPPQELGGYGRMMWEFAHGLIARGHAVRVVTADVPQLAKAPTSDEVQMESHVHRTLQLLGTWKEGRAIAVTDRGELVRRLRDNAARVRVAVNKFGADLVLAGNLDFLGAPVLGPALQANVPVLHALANATPGYPLADQPSAAHYWIAPCSDWNGDVFREHGYTPERVETLYPGARVDRFFRLFLPDVRRLRICYASLVLPYKGVDTLVDALGRLHAAGVDFSAEIAGDAPDVGFLAQLQEQVRACGMEHKVRFTGFLDRGALGALFARSNVLVFPSRFDEPFGISQVEALAAGLVVVSSGTGGAKEIIRDETDGLLFKAGDAAELAQRLARLAGDPALMQRLQRNAQSRATTFSVDHAVRKIEALAAEMQAALAVPQPVAEMV